MDKQIESIKAAEEYLLIKAGRKLPTVKYNYKDTLNYLWSKLYGIQSNTISP